MIKNIELAKRVREHVVSHPESHDQSTWGFTNSCGTVGCIAGWTLMLGDPADVIWEEWKRDHKLKSSKHESIFNAAQHLLGITLGEAWNLFIPFPEKASNTIALLDKMIAEAEQEAER